MSSLRPSLIAPKHPRRLHVSGLLLAFALVALLSGCSRFHQLQHEYVYVAARQVYIHDRVAAVSNRVAEVTNGQKLLVVERGKRFYKVTTAKNETGWIEEHAVIDEKLYQQFQDLSSKHAQDTVVAKATLRDELFVHILPGREQEHFYLMPENTRVDLLQRGTIAKAVPGAPPVLKLATKPQPQPPPNTANPTTAPSAAAPEPVPMEDWWLVRDAQGHTGWLLAGRLDVEVPDEIGTYAEGQRIVGAYPIATVTDNGQTEHIKRDKKSSGRLKSMVIEPADNAPATAPVPQQKTEYVTILTPLHSGLPFYFDQVRVFTWSLNHHRYETAFRLHGIQGYLPLRISQENVNGQQEPVFTFQIANGPNVTIDPDTGTAHPLNPRTISFRLEGNMIKRTGADQGPIQLTHPSDAPGAAKPKTKKKKH